MPAIIPQFLNSISLPKLDEEQLHSLNTQISDLEIQKTILSLPKNKSPGPDGFSSDYYQTYQNVLWPHLLKIYKADVLKSSFPPEKLTVTIVTLPKPGKTPDPPTKFQTHFTTKRRFKNTCQNHCK